MYARILLWLIKPALDLHVQRSTITIVNNTSEPIFGSTRAKLGDGGVVHIWSESAALASTEAAIAAKFSDPNSAVSRAMARAFPDLTRAR